MEPLFLQDCQSWIAQVEYQGQTPDQNSWTQTWNLWSIHLITFNIDWGWNIFISHNFGSMLTNQLIDLEKVRTETWNLGQIFEIELWMFGCLHSRWLFAKAIAKKIFKLKIKAGPVNAGHYMAFKHSISFATDLAANIGCYRFRITPDIVSKLLRAAIWSHCAFWFNLSRRPDSISADALILDRSSI